MLLPECPALALGLPVGTVCPRQAPPLLRLCRSAEQEGGGALESRARLEQVEVELEARRAQLDELRGTVPDLAHEGLDVRASAARLEPAWRGTEFDPTREWTWVPHVAPWILLDTVPGEAAGVEEARWIVALTATGEPLTNRTHPEDYPG